MTVNIQPVESGVDDCYQPSSVLVTGGCGFIGSNFLNYIFTMWPTARFVNVDKLILNSDVNYVHQDIRNSDRYKLVLADICNSALMTRILQENKIDTVIHFAADCTSTRCYNNPWEAIENNVLGFISFLEVIEKYGEIRKFIQISTDEVYGDSELSADAAPKSEVEPLLPGNPYAATKIACEAYVHYFQQVRHLPIVTLRINNIYGPNQWNVKLVPRFIEMARLNQKFPVQGDGKQLRSWLYVDDASEGIRLATQQGKVGEIYNLGTYLEKNVLDLASCVQTEVDRQLNRSAGKVEFQFIQDRPYNDLRYLIDISKAKLQLGWEPKTSFEEGLEKVVASQLKPLQSQKMSVVIYGGRGWIGLQVQKLLREKNVPFHLAKCKVGGNSDHEITEELNTICGTHVLCCTGRTHGGTFKTIEYLEGGPDRLFENLRDNFYCPLSLARICRKLGLHYTYVGTGYLFAYDQDHPIGEKDLPTFFGNSYSVVKGFTDQMMNQLGHMESINARITLPLNYALDEDRNLLTKIITYRQIFDIPVSITIIPDCFPALFKMMESRFGGALNLVNPMPISLHEILQLYKQFADPKLPDYEVVAIIPLQTPLPTLRVQYSLSTAAIDSPDGHTSSPGSPTHSPGVSTHSPGTFSHSPGTPTCSPSILTHCLGIGILIHSSGIPTPFSVTHTNFPHTPAHSSGIYTYLSDEPTHSPMTQSLTPDFFDPRVKMFFKKPFLRDGQAD
uniref:NAD(P)-binding domain-containing protein n=1 Tax=Ditylenchus dipsaci TaxID=166011 RepID=A0A915E174_9BILA